jgi:hypothetical protein
LTISKKDVRVKAHEKKGGTFMSTDSSTGPVVSFTIKRKNNQVVKVITDSSLINHFLDLMQTTRTDNPVAGVQE